MMQKLFYFIQNFTKSFSLILSGIITLCISALFEFHSLWQLDMICVNPVWSYPPLTNLGYAWLIPQIPWEVIRYADQYFQDGPIYQGTIGGAYDFFLGMNAIAWILAIIGMTLIMFGLILFYNIKMKTNQKI